MTSHEVSGQQDGLAPARAPRAPGPDGAAGLWVQAGGQLVEEEQLRVGQEARVHHLSSCLQEMFNREALF